MRGLIACLALLAVATGVWQLEDAAQGVQIESRRLGSTPLTIFRSELTAAEASRQVVLIAHGFAGSQQLMRPLALTLARSGFVAITFDFPGHGRNPTPMRGGLTDQDASLRSLLASMADMGTLAAQLAGPSGRYAVVGHSMASDIVVRHAQAHPQVAATVGISLFAPSITADTPPDAPRNLLVIDGAWEPSVLTREALRVVGQAAGEAPVIDRTYGRFEDGTARRATLSPSVEHIGVLYSAHTLAETRRWLQAAFARAPELESVAPGAPDRSPRDTARFGAAHEVAVFGPWLGLLLLGIIALAWSLAAGLPRIGPTPQRAHAARRRWWGWRGYAPVVILPALLTPLLLWKFPGETLPILLGDYLMLHFGLYGLLTVGALIVTGHRWPPVPARRRMALCAAVVLASGFALCAVSIALDRYVFNLMPEPVRLPVILAMCAGTLPWFVADEWMTRAQDAARGAYVASKLCFLLSLVLAIALNPWRLFFLALIVPAILLLFVIYGLFSRWTLRSTGHPLVAAIANALAFGFLMGATFPLVR